MEMARPRLQNGTRLATQGVTEMDSTGTKKSWTTERDVAPNRGALAQERRPHSADSTATAADRPKWRSLAVALSTRRRRED
ncbi:hypothetical protein DPMN_137947 [Dreissena polymorpha]|uniref:Uncharacterized protein n=1 Tax=Dreissena polymorpha TaxID=45954 RepID=A0A9D4G2U6_DREPO|nr:hypothetical protein DPMN_137947 [Dreissena polymorpha]